MLLTRVMEILCGNEWKSKHSYLYIYLLKLMVSCVLLYVVYKEFFFACFRCNASVLVVYLPLQRAGICVLRLTTFRLVDEMGDQRH